MKIHSLKRELAGNSYPGRGIILGKSEDGRSAVVAYFIMGRSENSRNRIFVEEEGGIRTQVYDPSKLEDPSLIIYAPVRLLDDMLIVSNGDQTDTICDGMRAGKSFEEALRKRCFEPDAPNYTPRISGLLELEEDGCAISLSILKSHNGNPAQCDRHTYCYDKPFAGEGYFIHTYQSDGDPLPSYEGEPTLLALTGDIDSLAEEIWSSLDEDNRVSLFVRYINLKDKSSQTRIINKNS